MPGFYPDGVYDLAGFCVGVCEEEELITGEGIKPGDILVGLPSSGFHSNGYSLIRKVIEINKLSYSTFMEEFGKTLGEVLLEPTRIYWREVKELIEKKVEIKGMANITGGGLLGNLVRILPKSTKAVVEEKKIPKNPIFDWAQRLGKIEREEMFRVFNMGVGFVLVVDEINASKVLSQIPQAFELGVIKAGERSVEIA